MHALPTSAQPPDGPLWILIAAMISASPQQPWVWAALITTGMALSRQRRR
ncbi:hypothetical protein [Streptomyces sp. SHP 1-2]|nr:hypothetical protein [Streptomyces sp. SHP 1-2]MCW5250146.1 hypothetical protein [Streptomyces sp. SHP 1-2]